MSLLKKEDVGFEELFEDRTVAIDASPEFWQTLVWLSVLKLHDENHTGSFYLPDEQFLKDFLEDNGVEYDGIDYSDWNLLDGSDDYMIVTDHVIKIVPLWNYVGKLLNFFDIDYKDDVEYESGGFTKEVGLQEAVVKYMQVLDSVGLVTDLRTKMGHEDEHSYKLNGDEFYE